jgi:hypothetical protein
VVTYADSPIHALGHSIGIVDYLYGLCCKDFWSVTDRRAFNECDLHNFFHLRNPSKISRRGVPNMLRDYLDGAFMPEIVNGQASSKGPPGRSTDSYSAAGRACGLTTRTDLSGANNADDRQPFAHRRPIAQAWVPDVPRSLKPTGWGEMPQYPPKTPRLRPSPARAAVGCVPGDCFRRSRRRVARCGVGTALARTMASPARLAGFRRRGRPDIAGKGGAGDGGRH